MIWIGIDEANLDVWKKRKKKEKINICNNNKHKDKHQQWIKNDWNIRNNEFTFYNNDIITHDDNSIERWDVKYSGVKTSTKCVSGLTQGILRLNQ